MELLADEPRRRAVAMAGTTMLEREHSKERQWDIFMKLAS
jgi:hypothetical protein